MASQEKLPRFPSCVLAGNIRTCQKQDGKKPLDTENSSEAATLVLFTAFYFNKRHKDAQSHHNCFAFHIILQVIVGTHKYSLHAKLTCHK